MEQITRIELVTSGWKPDILPLNYICIFTNPTHPQNRGTSLSYNLLGKSLTTIGAQPGTIAIRARPYSYSRTTKILLRLTL